MGILAVLWEKWIEFRRDFWKITGSNLMTPLMYLLVFGWGIDAAADGQPYLNFLIPGVVAMVTMTAGFGAVTQSMSVQRIYEKALDQVMISPTPLWQFLAGQVIGGCLRGLYAAGMVLLITLPLRTGLVFDVRSLLIMTLNGAVFAALGLVLSFCAKSYSDAPRFNAFLIVPMSFLCNTFFSTDRMPEGLRQVVAVLPLSQASGMLRNIAAGKSTGAAGYLILTGYLLVFGLVAVVYIYRKKNL